jgi:DNA-binding IscR family transcriptional regulator
MSGTRLDSVVHEQTRLAIMCMLAERQVSFYSHVRETLQLTKPCLQRHISTLKQRGYITAGKGPAKGVYLLSDAGWTALTDYVEKMAELLRSVYAGAVSRQGEKGRVGPDFGRGEHFPARGSGGSVGSGSRAGT